MSKFLTGKQLEEAIYDIIWEAQQTLLIVSPYIKLDDYFKKLFNHHLNNPKVHLIIVFGKNEQNIHKSLSKDDFDYFKQFPFISIIYVPQLHAKYYGNELKGVITSINLYDYSFIHNIEFGVFKESGLFDKYKKSVDNDAWNQCIEIASTNEVVFIKRPVYENRKMIINLGKNYIKSDILVDSTNKFYEKNQVLIHNTKLLDDYPDELELGAISLERPIRKETTPPQLDKKSVPPTITKPENGYCIRTGVTIKYNPKQPMSREAWLIWNEYKNPHFPEKFCHKTGKKSNGKTSMNQPILN